MEAPIVAPWDFTDTEQSRQYIERYGEKPLTRDLPLVASRYY